MTSEKLLRARAYENEHLPAVSEDLLPNYHLTGGVGWINDPNGFSLYKNEYHLFFQYNPYDVKWDTMHWGHVKTRDFIRWQRLPLALAPDEGYDASGCFSGSALELPDGRHLLMYTGVRKEGEPGREAEYQTQCLAVGDGADYQKYAGNPVITAASLPAGGSSRDFREPRIWQENGRYFAVVGNRCPDGSGAILLYQSEDAFEWRFASVLARSANQYGRMWECPDFFPLDGRQVLLVSPQEMKSAGPEFIDGNTTLCLIGQYDGDSFRFTREREQTIDYGLDFYAPQTVEAADGRRIMIAWMQYWNSVDYRPPQGLPFFGQMTLPRELRVRQGRLIQNPVRELEPYRGAAVSYRNVLLQDEELELNGIKGRCLDITVWIQPDQRGPVFDSFTITAAAGGGCRTRIVCRPDKSTVTVDRGNSGLPENILNQREFSVRFPEGKLKLRLLLDRYSLELFVNDGEQAATFVVFSPEEADGVSFSAAGSLLLDVDKYDLEFT